MEGEWCRGGGGRGKVGLSVSLCWGSWMELKVSESAAEPVEAGEWLASLEVLDLSVCLETDLAIGLLSSTQDGISHTECRLMPVAAPVEASMSYSTTGVSMGTL